MAKVLCSTGALIGKPNGRDYRLLKDLSARLNCDGFEFMIYNSWYGEIKEVIRFISKLNVDIPVVHCEKEIGRLISMGGEENFKNAIERFKINCMTAKELGAEKMVIHLWDGIPSDSAFSNNLKLYPYLKEMAENCNQALLVENVVCNLQDPMSRCLEILNEYPDSKFTYDTKMAAFHQQNNLLYASEYNEYAKSIKHFHINDYGGGYKDWENLRTLAIGKGNIDFEKFFKFIKEIDYNETFTVESTAFDSNGIVDFDMINQQVITIREYLSK